MNLLLPVLLVFPLVGALVMYPLRENLGLAKKVAVGTALLQIVLAAITWFAYSVPAAEAGVRFQLRFAVECGDFRLHPEDQRRRRGVVSFRSPVLGAREPALCDRCLAALEMQAR